MLDLDRFKHVNDVLGYAFGDALLKAVAERLRKDCVRDGDAVAGLSATNSHCCLPNADASLAVGIAARIEKSFERPLGLDDQTVDLGAGIGVACWPQHAADAEALIGRAEVAMYAAKRRGSGALLTTRRSTRRVRRRCRCSRELRHAVEHGELRLYLQPKVSLEQRSHRRRRGAGTLAASDARPGAADAIHPVRRADGLHSQADDVDLRARRRNLARIARARHSDCGCRSISRRAICSIRICRDKLDALLVKHSVPAEAFCLEITESAIMDDPVRAQATLERLSRRGFKLAIDDFGTGYSSLAYLKRLPVDELKIDKSFVMAMERELDDAKIVRSTIDLAHNLGLSVVAEGVESAATMHQLRELSCDEAQGFHLSKPMPAGEFAAWCIVWTTRRLEQRVADAGRTGWSVTIH